MTDESLGAPPAPPVCPRHTDRVSYVRCQRCERPACPSCQVPAPVGVLCIDCSRAADKAMSGKRSSLGFARQMGNPLVTIGLIVANVAFYLFGQATGERGWQLDFGMIPFLALDEPWRWVTSGFVHFGFLHMGLNMYMLFTFGGQLEKILGRARFALLYGLSLLGGSLSIYVFGADVSLHGGASGAVFGLFAAYGVVLYTLKLPYQSLLLSGGIWLVAGFLIPGISWQGHLGGALTGLLVMFAMLRSVRDYRQVR